MIILAYDGSIYGDWVARYALRFAIEENDRKLLVLHVLDGSVSQDVVAAKLAHLEESCQEVDVECLSRLLPLGKTVHRSLRQAIPPDPEALLVCGTRVKAEKRRLLAGSVAEQLLRMHQCPVLALRVVQPGLLGNPHELLLPLAGHVEGFTRLRPVFGRLGRHLRTVHLFRVLPVNPLLQAHLTPARKKALYKIGQAHLAEVSDELRETLPTESCRLERSMVISTAWPHEVLTLASRLKVQMMLLGVSERSLAHRIFHGAGIEQVLLETPCDVGIYRGP